MSKNSSLCILLCFFSRRLWQAGDSGRTKPSTFIKLYQTALIELEGSHISTIMWSCQWSMSYIMGQSLSSVDHTNHICLDYSSQNKNALSGFLDLRVVYMFLVFGPKISISAQSFLQCCTNVVKRRRFRQLLNASR